jgi:hypothetical protein
MRILLLSAFLFPLSMLGQKIEYAWPAMPCAVQINCDSGCTACALPVNENASFFGNDMGFLGVDVCPHPVELGDNALGTYGWPAIMDEDHMVILTGIAFTPTHIDSIIIRHRAGTDGPERLRVRFGVNQSLPTTEIADFAIPTNFDNTVVRDPGTVAAGEGMVFGFFSLLLQPYMGNGGSWDLDDIRIVGSAVDATAVQDLSLPTNAARLPAFDALGRPVIQRKAVRFYFDGTRRIVVE